MRFLEAIRDQFRAIGLLGWVARTNPAASFRSIAAECLSRDGLAKARKPSTAGCRSVRRTRRRPLPKRSRVNRSGQYCLIDNRSHIRPCQSNHFRVRETQARIRESNAAILKPVGADYFARDTTSPQQPAIRVERVNLAEGRDIVPSSNAMKPSVCLPTCS